MFVKHTHRLMQRPRQDMHRIVLAIVGESSNSCGLKRVELMDKSILRKIDFYWDSHFCAYIDLNLTVSLTPSSLVFTQFVGPVNSQILFLLRFQFNSLPDVLYCLFSDAYSGTDSLPLPPPISYSISFHSPHSVGLLRILWGERSSSFLTFSLNTERIVLTACINKTFGLSSFL